MKLSSLLLATVLLLPLSLSEAAAASTSCLPHSIKKKLNEVSRKFGPIQVISTHRPGARIRGSGRQSFHHWCRAVDFIPPKGTYGKVTSYLRSTWSQGYVLTYRSGHIHIDDARRGRPRR